MDNIIPLSKSFPGKVQEFSLLQRFLRPVALSPADHLCVLFVILNFGEPDFELH